MKILTSLRHSVKSRLAGPTALLVSRYTVSVIQPLISLLVVRYLQADAYGRYASAAAVTSLFAVLCDFGLQQGSLEMITQGKVSIRRALLEMLTLGCVYILAAYGAVVLWTVLGGYDSTTLHIALVMGIGFLQTLLLTAVTVGLQARSLYGRLAVWNLLVSASSWAGTLGAIVADRGIYGVVTWPIVLGSTSAVAIFLYEVRTLRLHAQDSSEDSHRLSVRDLFSRSWRFGTAGVMYQLYHRADSALLSLMRDPLEVGQFSVAFRIEELLNAFPGVVFNQILYPKYFRWFKDARERVERYYELTFKWMLALGVTAASLLTLFGSSLIQIVFGSHQETASRFLSVMAWGIPWYFVAASSGALLTTGKEIDRKLRVQGALGLANVTANALLIPRLGGTICAFLTVVTNLAMSLGYLSVAHRIQRLSPWRSERHALIDAVLIGSCACLTVASRGGGSAVKLVVALAVLGCVAVYTKMRTSADELLELRRLFGVDHSAA